MEKIKRFFKDEDGLELSEYAVMAALIVGVVVVTITALGVSIDGVFNTLDGHINPGG